MHHRNTQFVKRREEILSKGSNRKMAIEKLKMNSKTQK
jgi:hypothetical protein